jgi:HPt (histidine-containing phosphotransfer) domain-containing protein
MCEKGQAMSTVMQGASPEMPPFHADQRPIDLAHLTRQTMGNRDLEREILHLFLRQSERYLDRLKGPAANRAEFAHVILGSARGIGAHAVAEAAERLEEVTRRNPLAGDVEIEVLKTAVDAANGFIRSLVFVS